MFRKYTTGAYSSFYTLDVGYMVTPKVYDPATVKCIIGCHGHGGTGFQYGVGPLNIHTDALAAAGYIVFGIDHARINSYGDPDAMGAITDAYFYLMGQLGQAGNTKVGLMGWSMGGLTALNWTKKNPTYAAATWVFNPATDLRFLHDSNAVYPPTYSLGGASATQGSAIYSPEIDTAFATSTTASAAYTIPALGGAGITITTPTNGTRSFNDGLVAGNYATTGGVNFTYTGKTANTLINCISTTASTIAVASGQAITAAYAGQRFGHSPYDDYASYRSLPGRIMVAQANDDTTVPPMMNLDPTNGFVGKVADARVTSYSANLTGGHTLGVSNVPPIDVVNFYKANL
jgi:acetyl esterase/lipase